MDRTTTIQFADRFTTGVALDHLWRETMGKPEKDKSSTIVSLARVFKATDTPYAIIGGVAVQLYTEEPRTTLDVDVAVVSRDEVPVDQLAAAGFTFVGSFEWSDNWKSGAGVAVQFSEFPGAVDRAQLVDVGPAKIYLVAMPDLVQLKLDAAAEPKRRKSKRTRDKSDVECLLEEHPELATDDVLERLAKL